MSWNFWVTNWMPWSLQVLILSAAACLAGRLLRISEPRSRLIGAQAALLLCALFPFVAQQFPVRGGSVSTSAGGGGGPVGGRRMPHPVRSSRDVVAPGILAGGIALRLLLLGVGLWKLRAYRRSALTLIVLPRPLREAFSLTGVECRVAMSERVGSPAAFGFLRPVILLPAKFGQLPEASQCGIACHELLHIRRSDWLAVIVEELLASMFWFQPFVHVLLADIRLAREKLVDREVVALTQARETYLEALMTIAREPVGPAISLAPGFFQKKSLKSRVTFLIEESTMSKTKLIFANLSLAVLLFGAGWVSMATFPLAAAQDQEGEQKKAVPAADDYDFSKTFPPPAGKRIRIGGNAIENNLISKVKPDYPPDAKAARIQGKVKLGILIGTDGNVHDVAVVSGHPLLAAAAVGAVRQWVYKPVLLNGEPVETVSMVDVNFTLQK